jgi:hypothetical protein
LSALRRGIEAEYEAAAPSQKERSAKSKLMARSDFFQDNALRGELKPRSTTEPDKRSDQCFMHILRPVCETILRLAKKGGSLLRSISAVVKERRRQTARNEFEIERLDRIRNPSKYLGKN